jgi:hypothetical protein
MYRFISPFFLLILLLYFQLKILTFTLLFYEPKSIVLENMHIFEIKEYGTYAYGKD